MSTFERIRVLAVLFGVLASAAACNAEDGNCLRFSDCAAGLTCANGLCVMPPSGGDAAATNAAAAQAPSGEDATSSPSDESDTDATTDEPDDDASTE